MENDRTPRRPTSLAPEHDWAAASAVVRPALRPVATSGSDGFDLQVRHGSGPGLPLVKEGPAGLAIVYVLPASGFEVVVGVDHLLAWGVGPEQVHDAAMSNLATWSSGADWVDETDAHRRVVWSDS